MPEGGFGNFVGFCVSVITGIGAGVIFWLALTAKAEKLPKHHGSDDELLS